jgi:hypothetical protein
MGKPGVFKKINGKDQTVTPFKVYKSWRYTSTSSLQTDGIDLLYAVKPDQAVYSGNKVTLGTWQTSLDSGSLLINKANNKEASVIWQSLYHLYYKRAGHPAETFGYADPYAIERTLFDEALVFSIPQKKFGEAIKPNSVKLKIKNTVLNTSPIVLADDGSGNLIDTSLSSSIAGEVLYVGFDKLTYSPNYRASFNLNNSQLPGSLIDIKVDSINPNLTSKGNVWISSNKFTNNYYTYIKNWGNTALFTTASYIRVPADDSFNFKQTDDFAIAFYFNPYMRPTDTYGQIVSKRTTGTGQYMSENKVYTGDVNYNSGQYPFDIYFNGSGSLITCNTSTGAKTTTVSSSLTAQLVTGSGYVPPHITLQKTGSNLQLYVNGTLSNSQILPTDGNFYNNSDLFIGSLGLDKNGNGYNSFKGFLNDFFIFNKALTQNEITQLSDPSYKMTTNTNAVGNVFYEHGLIVISDPRPNYSSSGSIRTFNNFVYDRNTLATPANYLDAGIEVNYNSTITLYEHEYVCKIKEDEFNFTSNATIRLNNDLNSEIPKSMVSNDNFAPYITTLGLYNDAGQLIAVGKLGTPIRKRDNVDMNIIVKFDV